MPALKCENQIYCGFPKIHIHKRTVSIMSLTNAAREHNLVTYLGVVQTEKDSVYSGWSSQSIILYSMKFSIFI